MRGQSQSSSQIHKETSSTSDVHISVVIPVFNIESELSECLQSLTDQSCAANRFEIIIIDDGSTDSTYDVATKFASSNQHTQILKRASSGGPGIARNDGINAACGKYILFLDGDDFLPVWCLDSLINHSEENPESDAITFNWSYCQSLEAALQTPQEKQNRLRRDLTKVSTDKESLIRSYLGMNCDGSVIYTMAKKSLFTSKQISFAGGLHEDVATLFKIYYHAENLSILDQVLYLKRNRPGSIVNTVSPAHLQGMLQAWVDMKNFLLTQEPHFEEYRKEYISGAMGTIAVLIDKIFESSACSNAERQELFLTMNSYIKQHMPELNEVGALPCNSRYDKIAHSFLKSFQHFAEEQSNSCTRYEELYNKTFSRASLSTQKNERVVSL